MVPPGLPGGSMAAAEQPDAPMAVDGGDSSAQMAVDDAAAPSPQEQAELIQQAEEKEIQAGEQLFLVSQGWWSDWCAHTRYKQPPSEGSAASGDGPAGSPPLAAGGGGGAAAPEAISNDDILTDAAAGSLGGGELRSGLEENRDFVVVTQQSWDLLHGWYGGGPAVSRTAVLSGQVKKRPRVMLYPMRLELCWSGKPNEVKIIEAEKHETVGSLKARGCALFGVDPDKTAIWDFFHHQKYAALEPSLDRELEDVRILENQPILLDDKDNPLQCEQQATSPAVYNHTSSRLGRAGSGFIPDDCITHRSGGRPGLVGLTNLGNTCFMNSSLQCLMHSVPIMAVFLSGHYEADINTTNVLGTQGRLAAAFGGLISNVWKPEVGAVNPRGFKAKIAQFAPQFSGYQQHDSQEFLAFLLDGLHEDINRIHAKPYIEEPDSEGVPDAQLAATAWANYRARNDSHVVDAFQGLYKSTLVCPGCSFSSVKFDPFMYLTLPLPESRVACLTPILLSADGSRPPTTYGLELPQSATLRDLYVALARVAELPAMEAPEQQMVAACLGQRFHTSSLNVLEDPRTRISELSRDDRDQQTLLVYHYASPDAGPRGNGGANKRVTVYHRRGAEQRSVREKFSAPLLLWLPDAETYDPALHVATAASVLQQQQAQQQPEGLGSYKLGGFETEYVVSPHAPIWGHVRTMLQPFLAPCCLRQCAAEPPAEEQELQEQQEQQEQEQPAGAEPAPPPQQQQQQPSGSAGPGDVSMAAASALAAGSATASPEPCCTSQPPQRSEGGGGGAWGTDAGTPGPSSGGGEQGLNNRAASEGEANSTWGSHGSDSPRSDMDMPEVPAAELALPAARPQHAPPAAAAIPGGWVAHEQPPPAPGSGGGGADAPEGVGSDGELDANAAAAAQELGCADDAAAGGAGGVLLAGGVPARPLDMWADSPQAGMEAAEQQQQQLPQPQQQAGPFYLLKLARDGMGETTVVPSWAAAHFHPNVHHHTFTLDWFLGSSYKLPMSDYLDAAQHSIQSTAAEQPPQQPQQQPEPVQQPGQPGQPQQQAPGAPAQQQQQQQQQQQPQPEPGQRLGQQPQEPGQQLEQARPPAPAPPPSTAADKFWLPVPPPTAAGPAWEAPSEVEVCGAYVVSSMQQPQPHPSVLPLRAAREDPRGKRVSLQDCVEAFLQPEQLSEADEWYCPKCKTHVQADKKLDLWSLPEVLVVHLKRFSYTRWNRDKLDTQVEFPLTGLDLSRYVLHEQQQAPVYDLFAVSNHFGGLGGGHYTSFVQMPDDRRWYCFDDSRVEDISPQSVQSRAAYMLFYRRSAQAAADPPDLVPRLLQQRQEHLARKEAEQAASATAAAAEAAAAAAAPAAMEADAPAAGAGEQAGASGAAGGDAAPAAGEANAIGGGLLGVHVPPSPAPAAPHGSGGGLTRNAATSGRRVDSSSTSSELVGAAAAAGLHDDGNSSDGSSSRPRQPRSSGAAAAQHQAAADGVEALQVVPGVPPGGRRASGRRPSDQDLDADMADHRDV